MTSLPASGTCASPTVPFDRRHDVGGLTIEQARERRDELQEDARQVYAESPRTTPKAFNKARAGIKNKEETTFSPQKIDLRVRSATYQ